jgi:antitoxin Phd
MGKAVRKNAASKTNSTAHLAGSGWKLEDAKARFSEVVRLAQSEGPQRVSVRGKPAVVIISVEQLDQLLPAIPDIPFLDFMESLHFGELDLARERDSGREVQL